MFHSLPIKDIGDRGGRMRPTLPEDTGAFVFYYTGSPSGKPY